MARENPVPGEDGPTDVLSPFPAWQPTAAEEVCRCLCAVGFLAPLQTDA